MSAEISRKTDLVDDVNAAWANLLTESLAKRVNLPGRLTLETGVPISTTDKTAKTTLYYTLTGVNGSRLPLYNGTYWQTYVLSADLSITMVGLTASTVYDVFVYDNNGTPTLEVLAWASTTARATALTKQDGLWVKSGAATRLYLGTILIDAAGGACTDAVSRRGVYNAYNRIGRQILTYNSTASWTYSTAAWAEYNSGTGQVRGEFVIGLPGKSIASVNFARSSSGSGSNYYLGAAINATNTANVMDVYYLNQAELIDRLSNYMLGTTLSIGYNYLTQVHYTISATTTVAGTVATGCRIMMEM